MAAEYSYPLVQTVALDENVLFLNGERCCRKGMILHENSSGLFRLRGASNSCKTVYKVQFNANIAISDGGTVEPISIALTQNGEVLRNAIATVTLAIGDFFNVSIATFIEIPCSCCDSVAIRNISETTAIDVINANIIFDRVA